MSFQTPVVDAVRYIANTVSDSVQQATSRNGAEVLRRLEVANQNLIRRISEVGSLFDPRRNIEDDCGYPKPEEMDAFKYQRLYDWDAVAARIVEVFPLECFQVDPTVYEAEASKITTKFEKRWRDLGKMLRGEINYFEDESSSPIWDAILQADIYSGIGHYGVLLIGINDKKPLDEPADLNGSKQYDLLYLKAFPESLVRIEQLETDKGNARYGQPNYYEIKVMDPTSTGTSSSVLGTSTALGFSTERVHWTRIIHVSESGVIGYPRLQQVLHRVLDLQKLYAGSAEMYWRGAFPGISFEVLPEFSGRSLDRGAMKDMIEQYMNNLQRYVALYGMTAKPLNTQVVSPQAHIDGQLQAVCIKIACPKRIFVGSERGELASTQDDDAWNDRIKLRQHKKITPRLIIPTVNRLIALGVLPKPKRLSAYWPDITSSSQLQKAQVAQMRTVALSQYVQTDIQSIMTPMDFLTRELGYSEREAKTMLIAAGFQNVEGDIILEDDDEETGAGTEGDGEDDSTDDSEDSQVEEDDLEDGNTDSAGSEDDNNPDGTAPVSTGFKSAKRTISDKLRLRGPGGKYTFQSRHDHDHDVGNGDGNVKKGKGRRKKGGDNAE